jgi:hypothetical protein
MLSVLESIREKIGLGPERSVLPKRKLSTLMLMYREDQQIPLSRLMEEFSDKAQQLGVILRAADFKDI